MKDAKQRIRETTVDEVKATTDRHEKVVIVDVREESEFAKDHLPGAIHLGKGVIERDIEDGRGPKNAACSLLRRRISLRSRCRQPPENGIHQCSFHGRGCAGLARERISHG